MKHLWQLIFGVLAALSLFIFVKGVEAFLATALGDDFAVYWTWNRSLVCIDSYEDITDTKRDVVANSITVRRFSPWPSKVPLHFGGGPVETGSEVPYPRGMDTGHVWVNKDNQPIDNHNQSGHYYGPVEITALLQIRERHGGWLLFFVLTAAIPVAWVVHIRRYFKRRASRHP